MTHEEEQPRNKQHSKIKHEILRKYLYICDHVHQGKSNYHYLETNAGDSPYLEPLVQATAKDFRIATVTGDKGYSSRKNFEVIKQAGGMPIIAFKESNTGKARGSMIWSKCFRYYKEHPQEYLQIYHRRSKIEAVFGALKKRFGDTVLTKSLAGQKTEVLLKVLLHNLACLTRLYYEEKLEIQFNTEAPKTPIRIN